MKSAYVAGFLLGGLLVLACAPKPASKSLILSDDDATAPGSSSDSKGRGNLEGDESPSSENDDETPPSDLTDYGSDAGVDAGCKQSWWGTCVDAGSTSTKSTACTSAIEGNKSVTTVNYTDDGTKVRIVSMSTLVTNKNNRDKNNVAVAVKDKNATTYSEILKTGDDFPNGKNTPVPIPANVTLSVGGSVRIDTIFDDSFGDPTGSCTINF